MPVAVVNSGVWLCVWHFKSCSSCTWHPIRWVGTRGGGEKGKELHLWNVGGLILKGPIWIHHNGFQVIFGYQTLQLNQKMVKDGDYKTASLLIAVEIRNPSTNKSWYLWIQWEVREISIYFQNLHLCIQCIYIYIILIQLAIETIYLWKGLVCRKFREYWYVTKHTIVNSYYSTINRAHRESKFQNLSGDAVGRHPSFRNQTSSVLLKQNTSWRIAWVGYHRYTPWN